jgi:calpain, invertebrate
LIKGHAYTVVDMTEFESNGKIVRLLKCRNPWGTQITIKFLLKNVNKNINFKTGDDREWTGPWSDKSKEWKTVSNEIKNKINFKIDADGEFW